MKQNLNQPPPSTHLYWVMTAGFCIQMSVIAQYAWEAAQPFSVSWADGSYLQQSPPDLTYNPQLKLLTQRRLEKDLYKQVRFNLSVPFDSIPRLVRLC